MDSQIEIQRETEFYQGFIRLKMSVSNKAPSVITDVTLDFIYEDDLLQIEHYEPPYEIRKGKILLGNISGGTSKSIAVYFDPLMCTRGAEINCQLTSRDAQGKLSSVFMEPKLISVVCPIIKTELDINVGRLKEFIEKLPSKDSKAYEIQQGFDVSKLSSIAREVVEKHDVRHVRTLKTKDGRDWEIWYYGKTKVIKADIVIKVSISSEKQLLEIFAATESAEALTGLLSEVGRDLKHGIEFRASGKGNVINVTIKDSVIQRSNLLDLCSMDGTCPVNILVEDSVIQHSTFISEKDEAREENERLRKEREEQEKLRKQREEAERLEKIKRKAQEEADKRKKEQERKQQEELRRQREEAERKQREEERKRKEKEALEIKLREEKDRKSRAEEEKARREREEQEKLKKQREEAERKSREELEKRKLEEAVKAQASRQTVQSPAQQRVPPKKLTSSSSAAKTKNSSGKGILVFSLIFGVFLIGVAAMFFGLNGNSYYSSQEIQPVSIANHSKNIGNNISDATAKTNAVQKIPSQVLPVSKDAKISPLQATSPVASYAYITSNSNNVSVIDTITDTVITTVTVGGLPWGVAVSPDGKKVYVANRGGGGYVSIINTATNSVTDTVTVGGWPNGVAVSPDGTRVYVTNGQGITVSDNVAVIDTATNTVTATVTVGKSPIGVAVTPDGKKVYVTNDFSNNVSVIDTKTNTVTATVEVGVRPEGVAVTPDGTKVYVANGQDNTVSVINTVTNTVMATVPVGKWPVGVSITPDGTKAYVVNMGKTVSVIDTVANTVTATVPVGNDPFGVSVTPDGTKVYVANNADWTVSVIDSATNTVTKTVPVGNYPIAFGQFIGP